MRTNTHEIVLSALLLSENARRATLGHGVLDEIRVPLLTETQSDRLGYRGHQEGWITAEWKTSDKGRRAKYYSLTRLGRRQLEREADNWGRLSGAISRVVKLKEA
jgi:Transcriptional regulator PadR-like family